MSTVIRVIASSATNHLVNIHKQNQYMIWVTVCGLQLLDAPNYHLAFLENVRGQEICHACCELLPEELM